MCHILLTNWKQNHMRKTVKPINQWTCGNIFSVYECKVMSVNVQQIASMHLGVLGPD